jgi:hypothetical protein
MAEPPEEDMLEVEPGLWVTAAYVTDLADKGIKLTEDLNAEYDRGIVLKSEIQKLLTVIATHEEPMMAEQRPAEPAGTVDTTELFGPPEAVVP